MGYRSENDYKVIVALRALAIAIEQGTVDIVGWSTTLGGDGPSSIEIEYQGNGRGTFKATEVPPSSGTDLRQTQQQIRQIMEKTYGF